MIRSASKTAKARAYDALRFLQQHGPACPCHGCRSASNSLASAANLLARRASAPARDALGTEPDYAFEVAASNVRFGRGCTAEVGMDLKHLGAKKVALFTDENLRSGPAVAAARQSLDQHGIQYEIFDKVVVEPKDYAVKNAVDWSRNYMPDAYLAVGGGSVMDTAKLANLMQVYSDNNLLDFVNAPVGKAMPIERKLLPLVAVPTTAGTGSETTGTAIFDLPAIKAKVGVSSRALRPTLGIIDPANSETMPAAVKASSGLDVFCHALESYTAIPYNQRTPKPTDPILRPAYQGANPISDVFSLAALRMVVKYLPRSYRNQDDSEAHENMLLAATLAGVGFGNAGVHLCHGLSYPISSQNKSYKHAGYVVDHPLVPHGVAVAVTSPEVFRFTAPSNPARHLEVAEILGADISNARQEDAGSIISDAIREFLHVKLGDQPQGISAFGFSASDLPNLVGGALPQRRVLSLSKRLHYSGNEEIAETLNTILERSL